MSKMRSVMKHNFSMVPKADIQRSSFDRSFGYKTTFDAGYLIPVFIDEALPGDTLNCRMTAFGRLATPLFPFMDNLVVDSFFFAVPERLVWDNWQKFNGEQNNPSDSTDYVMPTMTSPAGGYAANSIFDYLGLPVGVAGISHRADFLRAYNLIYNEWFRDENLQDSVIVKTNDGPDVPADYTILKRGKRHDYFTSCLPWPQKGPAVPLPLGSQAPVLGLGSLVAPVNSPTANVKETGGPPTVTYPASWAVTGSNVLLRGDTGANAGYPALYADLSDATAATINQLRQAFQIQRLYERDARGGTRYTEIVRSHFGVVSPDARLQRPEYLGGGSSPVGVVPIAQTSGSGAYTPTPQGNLAAMGTMTMKGHGFTKSFTEHCIVIGMVCIRADLTYQQGMDRMWSRSTRWDFYWPALSHIGEQAVLNKEIYAQGTAPDADVFGYQERWAEYRYKPSKITGEFRSSFPQSLDTWHLSQDFSALPVLNASFIEENPPLDRVIAVTSEPHLLFDAYFNYRCARPMPTYSVPGYIDHF
ncbi:MAG: major capsid protein [Microvirus sp.]|nr:MAG: major capsid protein [Microvirus sp.]